MRESAPENSTHTQTHIEMGEQKKLSTKNEGEKKKEMKIADEVIYCRETKYKQIDVYFDSSRIFIVFNKRC